MAESNGHGRRTQRPGGRRKSRETIVHSVFLKKISKEKQGQAKPLFKPVMSGAAKHVAMRCWRGASSRGCGFLNARAFTPEGD
jgi:hypothetical protein